MPIYEYLCKKCNNKFEFLFRNMEDPTCSNCGSFDLAKEVSSFTAKTSFNNSSLQNCNSNDLPSCGKCDDTSNFSCPYAQA